MRKAFLVVAGVALAAMVAAPSFAEEPADLKAQNEALALQEGERFALAAAAEAPPPPKKMVKSGKEAVKLTISGQVNRMVMFADDGVEDEIWHVDNVNSGTRVRFNGTAVLNKEWSAGTHVEFNLRENRSDKVCIQKSKSITETIDGVKVTHEKRGEGCDAGVVGADGSPSFDTGSRRMEFRLTSKTLGTLWLGKGSAAADSTQHSDFTGTGIADWMGAQLIGGGIQFRDADTEATFGTDINDTYHDFDGLSQINRIRYDTPKFVGFQASTSHIQGDAWDVALRYAAKLPGFKVAAAIGYSEADNLKGYDLINGSAAVLFPMGFSVGFAAGQRDLDDPGREDPTIQRVKAGYQFKGTPLGKTYLSASFGRVDHFQQNDDESSVWSFSVLQKIDKLSMELYAGWHIWSLDRTGRDVEDINIVFSGARIKF